MTVSLNMPAMLIFYAEKAYIFCDMYNVGGMKCLDTLFLIK